MNDSADRHYFVPGPDSYCAAPRCAHRPTHAVHRPPSDAYIAAAGRAERKAFSLAHLVHLLGPDIPEEEKADVSEYLMRLSHGFAAERRRAETIRRNW